MSRISKKRAILAAAAKSQLGEVSLFPKQADFIGATERYTLFQGGFGAGKTLCGAIKGLLLSSLMPGNSGLVARKTYPELRDTTRKTFMEICPPSWILSWNESSNILTFKNGSEITFRCMDDIKKIRGGNYGWFLVDQAEETEEEDFNDLIGRLRRNVPRQYGFLVANPNGHDWIWKKFIKEPKPDHKGFFVTTLDNPFLPPDYVQSLINTYPKDWVDRFIYGSCEVKSGVILSEYSEDLLVDPFHIPSHWLRGRGMDWGMDKPTTRVAVALSHDGHFYILDEYSKPDLNPQEHAENILKIDEGVGYVTTKMDSTAWRKESNKASVAHQFMKAGISMSPATRDLSGSLLLLKTLMKEKRVHFFRGKTPKLIEEILAWKWGRPVQGKETPAVGEDHIIDAMRYIIHALHGRAVDVPEEKVEKVDGARTLHLTRERGHTIICDNVTGLPR